MTSLKVLSIKSKRSEICLDDWCHWLLNEMNPTSLEQLWLPAVKTVTLPNHYQTTGHLKALCLDRLDGSRLNASALEQLTQLGGVNLPLSTAIPHLRFMQAYCSSYAVNFFYAAIPLRIVISAFLAFQDLDNFCQHHPELERFHINSHACNAREALPIRFDGRWALAGLRSLVYASNSPHPGIVF